MILQSLKDNVDGNQQEVVNDCWLSISVPAREEVQNSSVIQIDLHLTV